MIEMPAGIGLPIAFTTVVVGGAVIYALVRRMRGYGTSRDGNVGRRPLRDVISRVAAVLLVGLIVTVANVNSFPDEPERSFAAWLLIAFFTLLPLLGGILLLLQYVRSQIGPAEFDRMASAARVVPPVLPRGAALKTVFVLALVMIVVLSTIAFQFGMGHIVF